MATNINGDTGVDKIQPGTIEVSDIPDATITAAKLDTTYLTPTGDGSLLTGIAGGGLSGMQVFTSPGTWTNPGSVTAVKVKVMGGGGGGSSGTGGTSSFGVLVTATGGASGAAVPYVGVRYGGVGSGGQLNFLGSGTSHQGSNPNNPGGGGGMGGTTTAGGKSLTVSSQSRFEGYLGGHSGSNYGNLDGIQSNASGFGNGARANAVSAAGAGGGYSEGVVPVAGPIAVTVGAAGTGGYSGSPGIVIVEW